MANEWFDPVNLLSSGITLIRYRRRRENVPQMSFDLNVHFKLNTLLA